VLKSKPSLWSFVLQPQDSDLEHFVDVPGEDHLIPPPNHVTTSTSHKTSGSVYKVSHRNPLYCGGEHTCLWELSVVSIIPRVAFRGARGGFAPPGIGFPPLGLSVMF